MKKTTLWKSFFLLFALIVGSTNVWADTTWSHDFSSPEAISNNSITVNGATWNISTTSGQGSPAISTGTYSSTYGLKFGSSKSVYYGSVTFSTNYFNDYNVKSVSVNILNNGSKTGTLSAIQGNTTIGTASREFGQNWNTLTVNTNSGSGGSLSFTYTVEQAFYIHSISVVYSTGPATYTVTYNANGGTGTMTDSNNPYQANAVVTLLNNTFIAPTGYEFSSWAVKDATNADVSVSNGKFSMPASNVTVTAQWQAYSITAQSNNTSYGTVSRDGFVITGNPAIGYRYASSAYTIEPANSATVVQNGNKFTVTPSANTTVTINFEAIPCYTVTFNAEGGSCGTTSLTESLGRQGVTLPAATINVTGWAFAGWAESAIANTTTIPTLFKAGSKYYPTATTTLYAVYTLSSTGTTYTRLTSLGQINAAKKIAVASQYGSKILTHDASVVSAPTETTGEITVETNQIFTLTGDNTTGYVLTGSNGTLSQASLSTSSSNDQVIDWSGTNNIWIISANTYADNLFALRNSASDKAALEQYNGWKTEYHNDYASRQYTAMKLYAPKTAYNSNPSAIITPAVEFEKDGTTLYLDANDKTYTNTANVTGVSKTVTYTSSNTNIATVDENGIVTAKKIGTVTITASVDAELGVSEAASDTYEIIIKNASNIAGIKAITDASSVVTFAADITDAVVTYVKNNHAYIQDASGAVYVEFTSGSAKDVLSVGNKINGAISGSIKAPSQIDQITALDLTNATVTEDGVVPAALEVDLATIVANKPFYDGKRVAVSNATVTVTLYDDSNSGGKITDDGGTTTMNLYSPDSGIGVLKDAVGDFAGIISLYGGDTPRFNLYEAGWVSLTRNAPTAQPLAFEESAIVLDEATAEYDTFTGQAVEGAVGTVSYSKTDDSNIIESLDAETGAITLSGAYGTATIKATAAAKEVTEGGVTTPYTATNKSYTITVYPRYTSTFSVNGVEAVVRQATHGAAISVPEPSDVGDYYFMGWATSSIAEPTDTKPSLVTPPTTPTSNVTYYAVYAQERVGGEEDVTSTLNLKQSEPANSTSTVNGVTWSWDKLTFATSGNSVGMKGGDNSTVTIDLPENAIKAKQLSLVRSQDWGAATVVLSNSNGEIGSIGQSGNTYINFTNDNNTSSQYSLSQSTSKNAWISSFTLTYTVLGKENYGYCTSLPVVDVTVTATGYLSYCSPYKLDFSETNVKAYTAKVEDNKVVLTKVDVVPAETGIVLYSSEVANAAEPEATTYTIPVTDKDASDVTGNQMVGVLERTQVVWNPSADVYNYILQQGKFNRATDGYLKANRAYLSTSYNVTAPGARPLTVVFADTATGINTLDNLTNSPFDNDAPMYNLAGQKVGKSYKGIVIQNGKKILKK